MTKQNTPLLGIDWGTSNRRAYVLDANGRLLQQHDDKFGMLSVAGKFEVSLRRLLKTLHLEQADVILSGMVGSRNGWRQVPYLSVEHPLSNLHDAMEEIETILPNIRCRIVPGYRFLDQQGMPDVMRGEETQVLGAMVLSHLSNGWFLLPGTHSKWVQIADGHVVQIVTFMTGELFALLSQQGTLANLMQEQQFTPVAFEAGIKAAQREGFTHLAFCCRALVVTDMMPAEHTASYLSGLLIGAELQEMLQRIDGQRRMPVQLIGVPSLAARYAQALELCGMHTRLWQSDEVYLAALRMLAGIGETGAPL